MDSKSQWVPLRAACEHLGVAMSTARKWIKAGVLRTKRTPFGKGRHMVLRADMEKLYR